MICFPNAKINIGLDIVARRSDGYHDLVTVFYPLPWRDVLEIVPGRGRETTLTVTGRGCDCPPEQNLVMRAWRAFAEGPGQGKLPAVDIFLRKVIPDGAGLGGGSADAAFTIRMLNEMFSTRLTDAQMAAMAAGLGADCAFFVYNRPMLATGTGTTLEPVELSLRGMHAVVVKPGRGVSTREAYAGVTPRRPARELGATVATLRPGEWQGVVKNDFEASVFGSRPDIAALKELLVGEGAVYASMSGSGAAVYGLFDSANVAARALEAATRAGAPGVDVELD